MTVVRIGQHELQTRRGDKHPLYMKGTILQTVCWAGFGTIPTERRQGVWNLSRSDHAGTVLKPPEKAIWDFPNSDPSRWAGDRRRDGWRDGFRDVGSEPAPGSVHLKGIRDVDDFFFDVIIGWLVVSVVRLTWFLLFWPWTYVAIGVWIFILGPLNQRHIRKTAHDYPQALTLLSAKPDAVLLSATGRFVPTIKLRFRSTYLRPYDPKAVVCVIAGPVYYAPDQGFIYSGAYKAAQEDGDPAYYLGVRQMTVHLVPLADLPADQNYDAPIIPAAERDFFFEPISASESSVSYVIAEPWRLLPDDRVERCKISEHVAHVADIQASMKWIGAHSGSENILDMLRTRKMAPNISEQVRAAYGKLYGLTVDDGGA